MTPTQQRAIRHVLEHITAHRLSKGDSIPGIRPLARQAKVSTVVMARAVSRLGQAGVLRISKGSRAILIRVPKDLSDVFGPLPAPGRPFSATKAGLAATLIRQDVLRNRFERGAALPDVKALCATYGVCYRTLRAALAALCTEGVLTPYRRSYRVPPLQSSAPASTIVLVARMSSSQAVERLSGRSLTLLRELERVCGRHGLKLEIAQLSFSGNRLRPSDPRLLNPAAMGGVVLGYLVWTIGLGRLAIADLVKKLASKSARVAVLDEVGSQDLRPLTFGTDHIRVFQIALDKACGRAAGEYLAARGHRRAVFVDESPAAAWMDNRFAGFAEGIAAGGGEALRISLADSSGGHLWRTGPSEVLAGGLAPAVRAALLQGLGVFVTQFMEILRRSELQRHLARTIEPVLQTGGVTALAGANDSFAIVCREFLSKQGIRVPENISVLGFDDSEEASLCKINSYNFNYAGLTESMVGFVAGGAVDNHPQARGPVTLDGWVVERGSVRAVDFPPLLKGK